MATSDQTPGQRGRKLLGAGLRTLGRGVVSRLPLGDRLSRSAQYWADVGQDWVATLSSMRGAAMKLGQLASQYADVLPPQLAEQLKRLQSSVEPLPFAEVQPILAQSWNDEQRAAVLDIEPQAIAAASIGQVHRARLGDGRRVIVKLRYPDVDRAVDADLRQLKRLISMSKLLPLDDAALDRLMHEIRARFEEEVDYRIELSNLQRLRESAQVAGIVYPEPEPWLCSAAVLVTSECSGETLDCARSWSQQERNALGQVIVDWALQSYFFAHSVHADPHPGNFAFRRNGEVVVYDYGCVKHVPAATVASTVTLLRAALARDWDSVMAVLRSLDGVDPQLEADAAAPLLDAVFDSFLLPLIANAAFDFTDAAYIERNRTVAREHFMLSLKFRPIPDLIFVLRALSGWYWLLRGLGCQLPLRDVLLRALDGAGAAEQRQLP